MYYDYHVIERVSVTPRLEEKMKDLCSNAHAVRTTAKQLISRRSVV